MSDNYTYLVRDELKYEYQEGTVDEIEIHCANGKNIRAHDCVLSFASKYLRQVIKKAKLQQRTENIIKLDFTIYPAQAVKSFVDLIYQVNVEPLSINGLLQNIHILSDSGHDDHAQFPWHARMISLQSDKLKPMVEKLSLIDMVDFILGASRIQAKPLMAIINSCLGKKTRCYILRIIIRHWANWSVY